MFKLVTVFTIKVLYKSGASHQFDAYEFSIKNGTYRWHSADDRNTPLELGGSEIAAVWQVGHHKKLVWSKKEAAT